MVEQRSKKNQGNLKEKQKKGCPIRDIIFNTEPQ